MGVETTTGLLWEVGREEGKVESLRGGLQREIEGAVTYTNKRICVCVRFSSMVHTGLVEGQISTAK